MISIETKFIGPTNSRDSRVVAFTENKGQRITLSWDYALGSEANHDAAARALAVKMGWCGIWFRGGAASRRGNVYVCACRFLEDRSAKFNADREERYRHDTECGTAVIFSKGAQS